MENIQANREGVMKKSNSMFSRILIPFLSLSLAIVMIFLICYAVVFTRYSQESILKEFSSETERLSAQVSQQHSTMTFAAMSILTRNDFFNGLKKLYYSSEDPGELTVNYQTMANTMASYSYILPDYDLIYLDAHGYYYNTRSAYEHSSPLQKISQEELASYAWTGELEESTAMLNLGENSMSARPDQALTIAMRLKVPSETIGYLIVQADLLENGDVFENLLRNQGRFALFSENGTCLYAQEGCPETLSFDELMRAANTKNRVCRTADGEKYVVTHKQTKEGAIHVVTLYPAYLLRQELGSSIFPAVAIVLLMLLLIVALSIALSNYLSKPLSLLTKKIGETTLDNLEEPFVPVEGNVSNEVMCLQNEYIKMRDRLFETMQDKMELMKLQEEQRYAVMQYQINPHFLYNTLNVIGIMGAERDCQEIERSCFLLAKLLRYSLQDYRDSATIEEEFESLQSYLNLMKLRFEHKIQYAVDLDPELRGLRLPRLTLQPLVENVFEHAFGEHHKTVFVCVRAVCCAGGWSILIRDNGQGITPEECERLNGYMEQLRKKEAPAAGVDIAGGIGVKNTLWRLNVFFEGDFDCRIANSETGGFEIELRGGMTGGT